MLHRRYANDGQPTLALNALQQKMKAQIDRKVQDGIYRFETVPCCICGDDQFTQLAEKDRYGLYLSIVICQRCGLIQTNPRMTQESYNEFYNIEYRKLYNGVDVPSESFFAQQYQRGRKIHQYLTDTGLLGLLPDEPFVLEVGCGAGGSLQYLREQNWRVKGVDLGAEYIQYGQETYGLDITVGTIRDVQLEQSPDLIIYAHVLEHILNPVEELQLVHRTLSNQGFLYIEVPGIKDIHMSRDYRMDFMKVLQNAHTYHFTRTTLQNLLCKNGFELLFGDEAIRSVFKPTTKKATWDNDHDPILRYLRRLEWVRRFIPLPLYHFRTLQRVGIYGALQKLSTRIKRRIQ